MKRYQLTVSGKVQGVFYRKSAAVEGRAIGISGFVKNLPNGNVYAEAQGTEAQLDAFLSWCRRGPERARVDAVGVNETDLVAGETGFEVRY